MMRTALVAGVGLLTLVGGLFALNKKRKPEQIPREKVLSTLKTLRMQLYPTLVNVSSFVKENSSRIPPDQLKDFILGEESPFMATIKSQLEKVFVDFTEEAFEENLEIFYKNDTEIQYHLKLYREESAKAFLGVTPEIK